jgi:hypothetical protein
MSQFKRWSPLLLALILAGCAVTPPSGPRVAVMPAPGKPMDQFAAEDHECRDYASRSVANQSEAATNAAVGTAVVGTVIGAAAGALVGGHQGAGAGAATGLIAGSAIGANQEAYAQGDVQRRYDVAYQQCMYAKGNQVPGAYPRRPPPPQPQYVPPPGSAPPPQYYAPPPPPQ